MGMLRLRVWCSTTPETSTEQHLWEELERASSSSTPAVALCSNSTVLRMASGTRPPSTTLLEGATGSFRIVAPSFLMLRVTCMAPPLAARHMTAQVMARCTESLHSCSQH